MRISKIFFILLFLPFIVFTQSGSPDDYYNGFNFNQSSSDLKTALANLIIQPAIFNHTILPGML